MGYHLRSIQGTRQELQRVRVCENLSALLPGLREARAFSRLERRPPRTAGGFCARAAARSEVSGGARVGLCLLVRAPLCPPPRAGSASSPRLLRQRGEGAVRSLQPGKKRRAPRARRRSQPEIAAAVSPLSARNRVSVITVSGARASDARSLRVAGPASAACDSCFCFTSCVRGRSRAPVRTGVSAKRVVKQNTED